jgi:hypothetical protein
VAELRIAGDRAALTPTVTDVDGRVVVQQLLGEHRTFGQTGCARSKDNGDYSIAIIGQ